ncbi:MAG: polyisoprenoid-binding protein [Alphaproteobacteria bacterium]|nr:MAG: polyisoprenoid-binding protein [Alphaproteobacteria bacterium]
MASGIACAETRWEVDKAKSKIGFAASYNGDPVNGSFAQFYPDIVFDPGNLDASAITVKIPIASIQTNYDERDATVQMQPWFDSKSYPEAVFISQKIIKTGEQSYHADGTLTIKGIQKPTGFDFHFTEWKENRALNIVNAVMQADFTVMRNDFKVGEGQWADDKLIGNKISVHLSVAASRPIN